MLPGDVCEKVDRVCSMASLPMEVAKWLNANYDSSWKPTKLRVLVHCNQALFSKSNKAIRDWPLEVKDSVYELDDILDYWVNQVLRLKHQEVKSDLLVKLQSSFLPSLHPSYPIVSQGELGKTTLAQLIFNHGMVVNHFESRIWAYVSENFDLMRVTKDIIEAASGCVCENLDIGLLQRKLQDLLQRKGYLLVLDDVLSERSKVAIVMGTMPPHELSMLSHNICWELFKHQAFVSNEVQEVGLERIGKEIVKKCGGVPLAAKMLKMLVMVYGMNYAGDNFFRILKQMNLAKSQVVAEEVCCITNDNDVTTLSERIHHISDHSWRSKSDSIQLHQVKSLRAYILPPYSLPPQIGKLTSLSLTMFFVGKEEGLCMAELKLLKLKGDLHIKHLEKVKSVMDASKASMSRYNGVHFPQWMSSSPSLKYLELEDRKVCSQLPELGKLLFLKTMHVYNMIHVKHLFEESYDGGVVFMALENLSLEKLPNLTRALATLRSKFDASHWPCLKISVHLPFIGFQGLTCLQDLWIVSCKEVEGLHEALQHITTLKKLRLESLPNLEFLPDCIGNLPLLRQLHIWNCDKLTCLPPSLSLLSSLKELMIWGCHPELEKRCEKEMGEDWPKIAHVPCVEVISWRQ
ncbi:hypothetical protein JHK87_002870 [Glycine soja]|nr:hypothetical protein JHK87_002870 [Glycine soja]